MAKASSTDTPYICVFLFDSLYLSGLINTVEQLRFEQFLYVHSHTQVSVYEILTAILLGRHCFDSHFIGEETGLEKVSSLSAVTQ